MKSGVSDTVTVFLIEAAAAEPSVSACVPAGEQMAPPNYTRNRTATLEPE
jgi:hypothetical protein